MMISSTTEERDYHHMTEAAKNLRVKQLEAELLSFERMLPTARDVRDARHIQDRIDALRRDLERARDGKLTANHQ
jgi:hypothetical protein